MPVTTNYGWTLPEVGADADGWGGTLNTAFGLVDGKVHDIDTSVTSVTASVSALTPLLVPSGFIGMWHGSAATIPSGWHLCDGTNGTPDLRDRFIVGAGNLYSPTNTGGLATQTATFTSDSTSLSIAQLPFHNHNFSQTSHSHPGSSFSDHTHGANPSSGSYIGVFPGGSALAGGNTVGQIGFNGSTAGVDDGQFGVNVASDTAQIHFDGQGSGAGHNHTGRTDGFDNRPPYYALCFIMKA